MRDKISEKSSEIYHLNPNDMRKLRLEKLIRTCSNCYQSHEEYKTKEERQEAWDRLKKNIKENGFLNEYPIEIMIKRKEEEGGKDQIYQGHHRLSIAIELGLTKVPVQFVTKKSQIIAKVKKG